MQEEETLVDQKNKAKVKGEEVENGEEVPARGRERPVPPDIEGYLLKLKHKPSTFSSWNKRYFKVNPEAETLVYFNSEKDATSNAGMPSKVFKLSHIAKVCNLEA